MPTWKSPLSAASLPSSTSSGPAPSAPRSRTTAASSRATSAGPKPSRVGLDEDRGRAADGQRGAQLLDRVRLAQRSATVAVPPVAPATRTASSTAHSSWLLVVKPA